jgi:hypothetical protein
VDVSEDGVIWRLVPLPRWARLHASPLPTIRASELESEGYLSADSAVRLVWALGLSWEWVLEGGICWTKTWLLVLAACACGMVGRGRLGTLTIAVNCGLSTVMFLVIAVSYSVSPDGPMIPLGELSSAATLWRRLTVNAAVSALLVWEGPFTIDAMCLAFVFLGVLLMATKADWTTGLLCAVYLVMALSLQVARRCVKTWVEGTLVLKDAEKYNKR